MNYFEFFDIPVSFQPDIAQLKKVFFVNSKKYHPDFHTASSDSDQEEALKMSALNNEAYKTLSDFDKRLKYILELKNVIQASDKDDIPQDFLMEMMEINESIMELQMDYNEEEYKKVIDYIDTFEEQLNSSVDQLFKTQTHSDPQLAIIKDYYYKRKYLRRIKENLEKLS